MVNGDKTIINRTEPMTLNKTWKNAALLAGIDPPIEARTAVIVVPIFDPNKNFRGYLNSCLINQKAHNFWLKHEDQLIKTKTSNFKCLSTKYAFAAARCSLEPFKVKTNEPKGCP